jgi:hypothetical protein
MTPLSWEDYCQEKGLSALVAERDGELVGFAVAESSPRVLYILNLEGDTPACRLLLDSLVLLAGERDMTGWLPLDRPDLHRMAQRLGFVQSQEGDFQGRPSCLYRWDRNKDVRTSD